MKVKIALQGKFVKLLNLTHKDGQKIETRERLNEMLKDEDWLNTHEHRRMITMVGVRIPVQGLNSMEFMEVYEFLPTEAGNVIVPPAEIVAKSGSDFDIDKLTVMMPSYQTVDGKLGIARQRGNHELRDLYERYKAFKLKREKDKIRESDVFIGGVENEQLTDEYIASSFGLPLDQLDDNLLEMLKEEGKLKNFEEFIEDFNGDKAIENDILWNIREILALPENYAKLIRPNDTDIVKPLADDLSKLVSDYNAKNRIFEGNTKQVSGTRVLEIGYNLYKHSSNNIGKQTLGLGAVDNTYNALFNRIGAYMLPTSGISTKAYEQLKARPYESLNKEEKEALASYKRQVILLPHNTIDVEGERAISLGHLLDAEGKNTISDVISQLINGWVDIAKDAWIFNIQGNKEIAPTLLLMVQAGVPLKSAVYLASLPIVRDYVRQQKLAKSTFAGPLDTIPDGGPMMFRKKALVDILTNNKYGFGFSPTDIAEDLDINDMVYRSTVTATNKVVGPGGVFKEDDLLNEIKKYKEATESGVAPEYSDLQRAAFLHFIELENMGKAIRDVKMRTNVDTSKSATLYEAQNRLFMVEELRGDKRVPVTIVDELLSNSPIASFYIQKFQTEIWKDLFKLRNHPVLNTFLAGKIKQGIIKDVRNTFGDTEKFANEFRNDLLSFIFQNSVRRFNIDNVKEYKGYSTDSTNKVEQVKNLRFGAFVKDGVMYFDKTQLKTDYDQGLYYKEDITNNYTSRGLAPVSPLAFDSESEFHKFVFERENLRALNPIDKVLTTDEFKAYTAIFEESLKQGFTESDEDFAKRKPGALYEMWLRDKALDGVFNGWKLFRSNDTYADQLFRLVAEFPLLKDNYTILRNLSISEGKGYTNLKLNDTKLEADVINVFHQNLQELADPTVKKLADPIDNQRISDFFKRFSTVAFLQSGINTKSAFSMVRVVPQKEFVQVMEEPVKAYTKLLNPTILEEFYKRFIIENSNRNRSGRVRYKNYLSELSLNESVKGRTVPSKNTEKLEITTDEFGVTTYVGDLVIAEAQKLVDNNPDTIFVYNLATESTGGATGLDYIFSQTKGGLKVGLPTRKKYVGGKRAEQYNDVTLEDGTKVIHPELKKNIDETIEALKVFERSGKKLAFNKYGYGQYMAGADPLTNKIVENTSPAIKSFLYLSEQLYRNFGYMNPNYDKTASGRSVMQEEQYQPISDKVVKELMKHCFL
jgi:hypothetical protein